jgi:excisionase family DNA binding protein
MPDTPTTPLFVRLQPSDASALDAAVAATGKTKRQLVGEAVRGHLAQDRGLVMGHAALREAAPEVLTAGEAAALLRVDEAAVRAAAEAGELPGRRLGDEWRFARAAVLAWLAGDA